MAKSGGSNALALLLLLGLLAGGGAWNYQRNLALESSEVRPYSSLSDADLATLLEATETEAKRRGARYDAARSQRASTEVSGTYSEERLRDFERVQSHGRAVRSLGRQASEIDASLAELRKEQGRRAGQGEGIERVLRLAFTF